MVNKKNLRKKASETEATISALFASAAAVHPATSSIWSFYSEFNNYKWKARVEEFMKTACTIDNISDLMKDEAFNEGLMVSFREFVKQRRSSRRTYIKSVVNDFSKAEDKENYELELIYSVIDKITIKEARLLPLFVSKIDSPQKNNNLRKEQGLNTDYYRKANGSHIFTVVNPNHENNSTLHLLYSNGLVNKEISGELAGADVYDEQVDGEIDVAEAYSLTAFGESFLRYITESPK